MATKVHLVDGTYELFRAYYGAPPRKNSQGVEVAATRSLLRNIGALLKDPDVTHVAVAFDHVIESFRNDLFDGYKTGDGIDPDLWNQFELAEKAMEGLGVVVWPMVEFEADDAIAAAAWKFKDRKNVEQVVICSPDKDMAQCVEGDKVICWDRLREKVYNDQGVVEKFGIQPKSIPDYLALVGDTADGIPGVPKWGAKSSATILGEYEHIENVPQDFEKWKVKVRGAKGLAQSLAEVGDDVLLYKKLATLRTDVPLEEDLDDLLWRDVNQSVLDDICGVLEMNFTM